jgi:hypothetical protein
MDSVGWPNAAAEIREADERIKQLQSEVERLMLVWSDERPITPGFYLCRHRSDPGRPWPVIVTRDDLDESVRFFDDKFLAGPIPAPLEPKEVDHA